MQDFAHHISKMEDCEAILEYVYALTQAEGAIWFSYNFTPVFESQTSRKTFIWARDYPFEWQKLYIGEDLRDIDPVPRLTFEHGPIMTWSEAADLVSGEGEEFFDIIRRIGAKNWATFALFGPRSRDGYVVIGFAKDPEKFPDGRLTQIQSLLQAGHLQICKIIDEEEPTISLSGREREVLQWMGRGKSLGDIATILAISPETVKTYTKRIYEKLETNDRVTATVRALKLGLVEL